VSFVSDFGFILGEVEHVAPLGPRETRSRLSLVLRKTLAACATSESPLVLFLDDVQWSDSGSRFILTELLADPRGARGLILLALRDEPQMSSAVPAPRAKLEERLEGLARERAPSIELSLGPLAVDATSGWLGTALGHPSEALSELAERVVRKTGGSPLLIREFIDHLYAGNGLMYSRGVWSWDLARIDAEDLPEGALGLILERLHSLAPDVRRLLELASCVADAFDVELLAELAEESVAELEPRLERLVGMGVLGPSPAGLRFVHDRLREVAQRSQSDLARAELHLRLGLLLQERSSDTQGAERALEIADHFRRALEVLTPEQRDQALPCLVRAGCAALAAGASTSALIYFRDASALLGAGADPRDPDTYYALHRNGAFAAFQSDEYALALDWLRVQVTGLRLLVGWTRNRLDPRFVDEVLAAFSRYGIHWPRSPSRACLRWHVWRTDRMLRGSLTGPRFERRVSGDLSWTAPLLMLGTVAPIMLTHSTGLILLGTIYCLRMYLRH